MAGKKVKGYAEEVRNLEIGKRLWVPHDVAVKMCREAWRQTVKRGWGGHVRRESHLIAGMKCYFVIRVF